MEPVVDEDVVGFVVVLLVDDEDVALVVELDVVGLVVELEVDDDVDGV